MNDINLKELLKIFGIEYADYKRRKYKTMEYKSFISYILSYRLGYSDETVAQIMEIDRTTVIHHRNKINDMIMIYEKTGGYLEQMNKLESVEKVIRSYIDFKSGLPEPLLEFRRELMIIVETITKKFSEKYVNASEKEINNFLNHIKKELEKKYEL